MRQLPIYMLAGLLLAGCGSSNADNAQVTKTPGGRAAVVTAPETTPPPIHAVSGTTGPGTTTPGSGKPVAPLATPVPVATRTNIPATAYNATLSGRILDGKTKQPIPGATVRVGSTGHVTQSDASGKFVLHFPSSVPEPVEVTAPGYAEDLAMGAVKPHTVTVLNFSMTKLSAGVPVAPPPPVSFGKP